MNQPVLRVGLCLVGVTGAVVLAAGCSSSSNGHPPAGLGTPGTTQDGGTPTGSTQADGGGNPTGSTQTGGNQTGPAVTTPAGAGDPTAFCKDYNLAVSLATSKAKPAPGTAQKIMAAWLRMEQEAPPEIRADVQTIVSVLKGGHADASKLAKADEHVARYGLANC